MTSREEIALQLTKTILENSNISKFDNVQNEVSSIYNGIYRGIETHNSEPITVLK